MLSGFVGLNEYAFLKKILIRRFITGMHKLHDEQSRENLGYGICFDIH